MATVTIAEDEIASIGLNWTRGDAHTWLVTWVDPDGDPIDLSGAAIEAQLRPYAGATAVWNFGIDMTDAASGIVGLVCPTDSDLPLHGVYDVRQAGPQTILRGTFTLDPPITELTA